MTITVLILVIFNWYTYHPPPLAAGHRHGAHPADIPPANVAAQYIGEVPPLSEDIDGAPVELGVKLDQPNLAFTICRDHLVATMVKVWRDFRTHVSATGES